MGDRAGSRGVFLGAGRGRAGPRPWCARRHWRWRGVAELQGSPDGEGGEGAGESSRQEQARGRCRAAGRGRHRSVASMDAPARRRARTTPAWPLLLAACSADSSPCAAEEASSGVTAFILGCEELCPAHSTRRGENVHALGALKALGANKARRNGELDRRSSVGTLEEKYTEDRSYCSHLSTSWA